MKKLNLVFVEDNDMFRESLRYWMEKHEAFDVKCFRNAAECKQNVGTTADLLILDIELEEEYSGLLLYEWFNQSKKKIPAIFLSGKKHIPSAIKAMKAGVYDYLSKDSFEFETLDLILNNFVQDQRLKQDSEVLIAQKQQLNRMIILGIFSIVLLLGLSLFLAAWI